MQDDNATELFKCCRCKEFLSRGQFGGITKRNDYCKPCRRAWEKEYRNRPGIADKRRATNNQAAAKRYATNRSNLVDYLLDHPCVDCGESDPVVLQFDHRDQASKRAAIGDILGSWTWATIMEEIEKCDVRCANCHVRRTHVQLNWYTKKLAADQRY